MKGFCWWPYLACKAAGGEEGKVRKEGGEHEVVASSKENKFKTRVQNRYPIYDQNGQNRYPIYDKMAEKPYPLGLHIPTCI